MRAAWPSQLYASAEYIRKYPKNENEIKMIKKNRHSPNLFECLLNRISGKHQTNETDRFMEMDFNRHFIYSILMFSQ